MKTNTKNAIAIIITIVAFAALVIVFSHTGKMKMNPDDAIGNTAGNLNNDGLFCEIGDKIYFSNLYDGGALYSMNTDQTDLKLINESNCYSINGYGNYLYYCMRSDASGTGLGSLVSVAGTYRSKINGKQTVCLDNKHDLTLSLCGNYVFYQRYTQKDYTTLMRQKIDKSDKKQIADYVINPSCVGENKIFFGGTVDDHHLYSLDPGSCTVNEVSDLDVWDPVYQDGYIYYMDIDNNYRLCRYSLFDDSNEVLTDDRLDFFNVLGDTIFYAKSDKTHPALIRMKTDGSSVEEVKSGVFKMINMTSSYTYFCEYGNTTPMYMTPTYGSISVTTFDAAESAAAQHISKK